MIFLKGRPHGEHGKEILIQGDQILSSEAHMTMHGEKHLLCRPRKKVKRLSARRTHRQNAPQMPFCVATKVRLL